MGRKPKPVEEIPGFQPIEDATCPDWLDDIGQEHWHQVAPQLKGLGLLSAVDLESLGQMCQAYSDYRNAVAIVREQGQYFEQESTGMIRLHPGLKVQQDSLNQYNKIARDFGIIAANRRKVKPKEAVTVDPLTEFLPKE